MRANPIQSTCIQCAIFILLLLYSGTVLASGKIVTKINVITGMSNQSNYFLSSDNERSVWAYHVIPGIEFGYTTPKSNLIFNYILNAHWYNEKDAPPEGELDMDELNYIGHDMKFAADTQLTDRLKIALKDDFILTRDQINSTTIPMKSLDINTQKIYLILNCSISLLRSFLLV